MTMEERSRKPAAYVTVPTEAATHSDDCAATAQDIADYLGFDFQCGQDTWQGVWTDGDQWYHLYSLPEDVPAIERAGGLKRIAWPSDPDRKADEE